MPLPRNLPDPGGLTRGLTAGAILVLAHAFLTRGTWTPGLAEGILWSVAAVAGLAAGHRLPRARRLPGVVLGALAALLVGGVPHALPLALGTGAAVGLACLADAAAGPREAQVLLTN